MYLYVIEILILCIRWSNDILYVSVFKLTYCFSKRVPKKILGRFLTLSQKPK